MMKTFKVTAAICGAALAMAGSAANAAEYTFINCKHDGTPQSYNTMLDSSYRIGATTIEEFRKESGRWTSLCSDQYKCYFSDDSYRLVPAWGRVTIYRTTGVIEIQSEVPNREATWTIEKGTCARGTDPSATTKKF